MSVCSLQRLKVETQIVLASITGELCCWLSGGGKGQTMGNINMGGVNINWMWLLRTYNHHHNIPLLLKIGGRGEERGDCLFNVNLLFSLSVTHATPPPVS